MGLDTIAEGADRFEVYLTGLKSVIGHADRTAPLHDYCLGLLATDGRKSVEPMAATTAPAKVSVQHHYCPNVACRKGANILKDNIKPRL